MTGIGMCEKGSAREENQDSILIRIHRDSGLFVVADGVAGAAYGALASKFLTESCFEWWNAFFLRHSDLPFAEIFEEIKFLAENVNQELVETYGAGNSCSTVALLFIHKAAYGYLSAGDSRIYLCDKRGARQITRDDIWENQPNVEHSTEHRGKILSAVGGYASLDYSCATDRMERGTGFLLCSDGIYKYVDSMLIYDTLRGIYRKPVPGKRMIRRLTSAVGRTGADDNYSLIVVKA